MEAVVDGLASAAALAQDLPVFEPGDDVFDAGADAAVCSVEVVVDDVPGVVARRCGDGVDAAVAAVAEDDAPAGEQVRNGVAGHDVVAVAGPESPTATTARLGEQMMIWVLMLRRWFLAGAVMAWWWTGIGVSSMIHGVSWVAGWGRSAVASVGTRW